jgi:hypothetical protein
MVPEARLEGFTDGAGRTCVLASATDAGGRWHLLATRGPRTLAGASGTGPARAGARRALSGFGSFGIVEDDDTRAALAAILVRSPLPPPVRALVAATGAASAHCALGDLSIRRLRSLDGRCGRDVVDGLASAHPHLMPVVGLSDERLRPDGAADIVNAAARGDTELCAALRTAFRLPAADGAADSLRALLRGLRGIPLHGHPGVPALLAAGHLPADWMPRDAGSARAFGVLAALALALRERSAGALCVGTLLAPARGRWEAFLDAVAPASGVHAPALDPRGWSAPAGARSAIESAARSIAGEVGDMAEAFAVQCAAPAVCRTEALDADKADLDYALERLCRDLPRDPAGIVSASWAVLFGGKGLLAALRSSGDWHARQPAMDLSLRTAADPRSWDPPFAPFEAPDGRWLVALSSAADLAAEGAALRHCVGTYAGKCLSGESVIVSLRRGMAGEGRSSTAEFSLAREPDGRWVPSLIQHKALCNGVPEPEDVEALAILLGSLSDGTHPVSARPAPGVRRRRIAARLGLAWDEPEPEDDGDALRDACGYDWRRPGLCEAALSVWSRFLPRGPLRSDPALLCETMGLRGGLLDLPAARAVRSGPAPRLRKAMAIADATIPLMGALLLCGTLVEAARNLARPAPDLPVAAMPALAGDEALAWSLVSIASGPDSEGCPDWTGGGPDTATLPRCGRRGGLLAVSRPGSVTAHLVGAHPPVELFRRDRAGTGPAVTAWPAGPEWRTWLAAAASGDDPARKPL